MILYKGDIVDAGQQRLSNLRSICEGFEVWKAFLIDYRTIPDYPDDLYVWLTCLLALASVESGNFGVGGVLVNQAGDVVIQGHNQVFYPYFRSDRHAEMVVMDSFENSKPPLVSAVGLALYTSLEPCPMCLVRLSAANVDIIRYAAPDEIGGMVLHLNKLPPLWRELAQGKVFSLARCSKALTNAAAQIFYLNLDTLMSKLKAR